MSGERIPASRAKWLHIVTAKHLRKARQQLRALRYENGLLWEELDGLRGDSARKRDAPPHYGGDSFVTCSRAMEAAASQPTVAERTPMQAWWWMCAFKYVWRMWSKQDPKADAHKAVDCLLRATEGIDG